MSADITSALSGGASRPPAPSVPAPDPARVQAAAAATEVQKVQKVEPKLPEKAQLTIDPAERQQQLREAIEQLNEQMRQNGRSLAFSYDKVANRTVVTVTNQETGEVVRQFPDEAMLRVAHNLERVKGLLTDGST